MLGRFNFGLVVAGKYSINKLSDIIISITDFIVRDTIVHGHNYSRSTVSGKSFIFGTVNTKFRLKELSSKEDKQ